jgi:hypothetical protein
MAKRNDKEIKVVVMNPERIPFMEEKLTKLLYEEYIRKISREGHNKVAQ